MSAFNDNDANKKGEEELAKRFRDIFGKEPMVNQANQAPKSEAELKKGEEELAKRFRDIFGKEPMVNQANQAPKSEAELKKGEDELAQRFKSIFGTKPMVYDDDNSDNNVHKTNVNTSENNGSNFTYDGNDDDIDLLFAETENVNEEEIIQDTDIFLGSLTYTNGSKTDSVTSNSNDKNTEHIIHVVPPIDVISDEAEDLIRQTKEKIQLEGGKNMKIKSNNSKNVDANKVVFSYMDDFDDEIDDEVREVILRAKEEARLDQKFGLSQEETQQNDDKDRDEDIDDDDSGEETSSNDDDY